ncbi:hypothetical protein [Sporichthya polymorpha]|uniref:hypothetical protein n=1 Tax=Sporichthya polymorpha TaxID=35751 RepID=UPI0003AA06BF|nr:hypothetical protein [Sporichthya polymorpha]
MDDDAILLEFGALLWEAIRAFGSTPDYWADMVEAANTITYKQLLWAHRADPTRVPEPPPPSHRPRPPRTNAPEADTGGWRATPDTSSASRSVHRREPG